MRLTGKILKLISGVLITVISIHSNLAVADYDVRVTNNSPFYVQIDLQAKAVGEVGFSSCGTAQILSGQNKTESCSSNVDNWKRKFLIVNGDSRQYEQDCTLNVDAHCQNLFFHESTGIKHGISQLKWSSGRTMQSRAIQSPNNGGWHDKWVVRDQGRYNITVPKDYCGNIFRAKNNLFGASIPGQSGWVDDAQKRSQVTDTMLCMGMQADGSPAVPSTDEKKDRFEKRIIKGRDLPGTDGKKDRFEKRTIKSRDLPKTRKDL